jgi:lipocalin
MERKYQVFPVDEKMQMLAEVDTYVGTWVDLAAVGHSFLKNANL